MRAPAIVIVSLVAVVVLTGCGGSAGDTTAGEPGAPAASAPETTGPGHPATTPGSPRRPPAAVAGGPDPPPPVASPTPSPSAPGPSPRRPADPDRLEAGDEGPRVARLQRRLAGLGYWIGTPDGVFGTQTFHAVVALQKAAGISRDGIVGPVTRGALERGVRPSPRSSTGRVVEIDRERQILLLVDRGRVRWVFDTSTGRSGWTTPEGRFEIEREIDGYRVSRLGVLYRPKYFYRGIALHGAESVPPYPASHGCVRVTEAAMDHLWETGALPRGTPVWVY